MSDAEIVTIRRWVLKACPECNYAVALTNAPIHKEGCSHPDCVEVVVKEVVK
jgi:hypothetical protein